VSGLAALVLAGGQARRMGGGDKPLLELGGQSLLARILDRLAEETGCIAISANGDPARFAAFARPVLADGAFLGQGPLAGVLAGLDWAAGQGAEALLTVPGDTPFLPAGLAGALAPAPSCAASAGRTHPLVALWPVAAGPSLRELLSRPGARSVKGFAASVGMRVVDFPLRGWDPFINLNDAADLTAARELAGRLARARGQEPP
jgi:molybdopterin-guanine dinucleotide biosynthesis protein A